MNVNRTSSNVVSQAGQRHGGSCREQPHFVLGAKNTATGEAPAARSGAPRSRHPRVALYELSRPLSILAIVALLFVQAGCGYSLSGRGSFLPAYIKRIGVPSFTNATSIFDVDRRVTDRVRSELLGRGKYVVVPETTGVDAVLSGEILSITVTPAAFNAQQQATRYALTLTAKVEFKDLRANKVLWANPAMQYREEFDVTTTTQALDATAFFGQDVNAVERIAGEFARSVVSAILEAF